MRAHPLCRAARLTHAGDSSYAAMGISTSFPMVTVVNMVSQREVLPTACRVLPILLAVGGTVEYVAAAPAHLGRALLFLYAAAAALLVNQRYSLGSPLAALLILAVFAGVYPHAATDPNIPLFLAMFAMFALAAFKRGHRNRRRPGRTGVPHRDDRPCARPRCRKPHRGGLAAVDRPGVPGDSRRFGTASASRCVLRLSARRPSKRTPLK